MSVTSNTTTQHFLIALEAVIYIYIYNYGFHTNHKNPSKILSGLEFLLSFSFFFFLKPGIILILFLEKFFIEWFSLVNVITTVINLELSY